MIASEELIPGTGFAYNTWLKNLAGNPSIDPYELCKACVDTYIKDNTGFLYDEAAVLCVVDLDAIDSLTDEIERMSGQWIKALSGGSLSAMSRQRQGLRGMGGLSGVTTDLIDLASLARAYGAVLNADMRSMIRGIYKTSLKQTKGAREFPALICYSSELSIILNQQFFKLSESVTFLSSSLYSSIR
jgi:hypothetical protein